MSGELCADEREKGERERERRMATVLNAARENEAKDEDKKKQTMFFICMAYLYVL